jgi:hypothetical protein
MSLVRGVGEGDAVEDRVEGEEQVEVETVQCEISLRLYAISSRPAQTGVTPRWLMQA